jgi:GLPGLI family protein
MKYAVAAFAIIFTCCFSANGQEAKVVSDCTVLFEVSVEDEKADPKIAKAMAGSTKVLYLKGSKSRSDLITPGFKQTTLFDSKTDSTVILRELGNSRYITYLNETKKSQQNKKYAGIQFTNTTEKKTILGYECNKVVAKLGDGSTFNVYYTPSITPANKEYEYQFKDLPGFVLEYEEESENGKTKIKYSATKITLVPVPIAKFDLPKSGYRVL